MFFPPLLLPSLPHTQAPTPFRPSPLPSFPLPVHSISLPNSNYKYLSIKEFTREARSVLIITAKRSNIYRNITLYSIIYPLQHISARQRKRLFCEPPRRAEWNRSELSLVHIIRETAVIMMMMMMNK